MIIVHLRLAFGEELCVDTPWFENVAEGRLSPCKS